MACLCYILAYTAVNVKIVNQAKKNLDNKMKRVGLAEVATVAKRLRPVSDTETTATPLDATSTETTSLSPPTNAATNTTATMKGSLAFSSPPPPKVAARGQSFGTDRCPLAVRRAVGVFRDDDEEVSMNKTQRRRKGWNTTVLLTAANFAYLDILQNWEFLARQQNLQWAVLALDWEIYQALGGNATTANVVMSDPRYAIPGARKFRQRGFNILSCNKMRQVLRILRECQVDVVFSDCDNVFLENPFTHDFGKLIRSRKFDYIYQPNQRVSMPRSHPCLERGEIVKEGNTGFYYLSHTNAFYQELIEETLKKCEDPDNRIDDQTLFWTAFHRKGFGLAEKDSHLHSENITHCTGRDVDTIVKRGRRAKLSKFNKDRLARLCCLDGFDYPVGQGGAPENNRSITYHANYCAGKPKKIEKLKLARPDGYGWSASRVGELSL